MRYFLSENTTLRVRGDEAMGFNAALGHAFSCVPSVAEILSHLHEPVGQKDLLAKLSKATGDTVEAHSCLEYLIDAGHLVSDSCCQDQQIPVSRDFLLRLVVTEKCNFRCTYCYESLEGRESGGVMSSVTGRNAISYFKNHLASSKIDSLEFRVYGGEPLLVPDLVLEMYDEARGAFSALEDGLFLMLNTNGSLVTAELSRQLSDRGVSVAVSLDGLREHNDSNRVFPDGAGTYYVALNGIRCLLDHNVRTVVNVTVSDCNITSLHAIVDDLAALGVRHVSLNRLKPGPAMDATSLSREYYARFISEAISTYKYARKKGLWVGGLWARYLDRLVKADAHYCTACGRQMVVSPNGTVFSCPHLYGDDSFSWGNVNTGDFDKGTLAKYQSRTPTHIEQCSTCYIRGICSGGCPAVAHFLHGSVYAPESCELHKLAVEKLLWELPLVGD